mmetsp:Transcript_65679/g.201259  ORF Transcript_65679/g.201259 Transcript_65679/m.201259 type:complete len:288 (-) Transcript_65679:775-1638(-)
MCQRVMERHQAVPHLQRAAHGVARALAPEPGEVRLGLVSAVDAHGRHERTNLHPPRQKCAVGLAGEAADVASHVGRAGQDPIEHHSGRPLQVLPRGLDVAGPDRGAEPGHARREGAVEGVEAPDAVLQTQGLNLSHVPPIVREVITFAFVVPPEGDAVLIVMLNLVAVPIPHLRLGEVEAALLRVAVSYVRRPRPPRLGRLEHPPLRAGHVQETRVAEPGLADHADSYVLVRQLGELLSRRIQEGWVVAEVLVRGLSRRRERVVCLRGEPLEIENNSVDGVPALAEL